MFSYLHAESREHAETPFPSPQRLLQKWEAVPLLAPEEGAATQLRWPAAAVLPEAADYRLRLAVAVDVREPVLVRVESASGGMLLGEVEMSYSYPLQPFELRLDRARAELLLREGARLSRVKGSNPFWVFWRGPSEEKNALCPHLLASDGQPGGLKEALDRLCALDSLQPLGWLEGCVLDAQLEWSRADPRFQEALRLHLAQFTGPAGELVYENPRNLPTDGKVYGEEGPLPFAILAQVEPGHPWLEIAAAYFRGHSDELRLVKHEGRRVAETSYTCAYPLAAMGPDWADFALDHLRWQKDDLVERDELYLRRSHDGASKSHKNWARAYSWYMLGLARSLPLLPAAEDLRAEFRRIAEIALRRQLSDGLWSVYLDDASLVPDTGGSAGIAAALALGVEKGLLPRDPFLAAAQRARQGLGAHLTPDGFLAGVSQSNKGGEELQRGEFRVIAQFGLGLYGLLTASLERQGS